jgi:hypothetical protein
MHRDFWQTLWTHARPADPHAAHLAKLVVDQQSRQKLAVVNNFKTFHKATSLVVKLLQYISSALLFHSRLTVESMAPKVALVVISLALANTTLKFVNDKRKRKSTKGRQQQATAGHEDSAAAVLSTPEGQEQIKPGLDITSVVVVNADYDEDGCSDGGDSTAVLQLATEVSQRTDWGLGMALLLLRIVSVMMCSVVSFTAFFCLVGITWTTLGSASLVLLALAAPMAVTAVRGLRSRWHNALDEALGGFVGEAPCKAWDNSFI